MQIQIDFNTSNVTIQRLWWCCMCIWRLISIHLMLLFNSDENVKKDVHLYFNTSNVTIQPAHICYTQTYVDFNTSNVTIQPFKIIILLHHQDNFNTSNVTIQPTILSHLFYSQFHYTHYISTFSWILPANSIII